MKRKKKTFSRGKMKMTRLYTDREMYGIEFDNRLIQLVRENPAIYDVQHPHYRRNQVRIAIWERIAFELSAPSKFVQTKWKNIRYNYLQELKSLETGIINTNIRKRRFTEDLSFLQNTAQTYNMDPRKRVGTQKSTSVGGGSDNESNSYMYPDNNASADAYEVIEIEHSDDNGGSYNENDDFFMDNALLNTAEDNMPTLTQNNCSPEANEAETSKHSIQASPEIIEKNEIETTPVDTVKCSRASPVISMHSNRSSPLLTPMGALANGGGGHEKKLHASTSNQEPTLGNGQLPYADDNINSNVQTTTNVRTNSSVASVKASPKPAAIDTMSNMTRRKAMPTPFPVLTPINDPIELYCLSLVDSLRSMPRTERERVKYEFAKILKDAKYKDES